MVLNQSTGDLDPNTGAGLGPDGLTEDEKSPPALYWDPRHWKNSNPSAKRSYITMIANYLGMSDHIWGQVNPNNYRKEGILFTTLKQTILEVYAEEDFVKTHTARRLGINTKTLYNWLKEWKVG